MARVFAPPVFFANDVSARLLEALYALPEEVVVLLEFFSPGPYGRQVDVAVLGPNGVDVIEVKNKSGTVIASDHGAWHIVEDRGGTTEIPLNKVGGRSENPWDQVQNTADDFKQGIINLHGFPRNGTVGFAVLVPEQRAQARMGHRGFARGINGVEELPKRLRSLQARGGKELWSLRKRLDLAERLELCEVGIAAVSGAVVDATTRAPVPGAQLRVGGVAVATDDAGAFSFAVPAGYHAIEVRVPGVSEAWRFDKSFAQGATKRWEIPISSAVPASPPSASGDDVANAIKELSAKLEMDRAERDVLFELMADAMERAQTQPAPTVATVAPSGELDSVLRELQAIRKQLEEAREAERTTEGIGTIERGMELVLALEKARADEMQAIVPAPVAHRDWDDSGQADADMALEPVDVEVRDVIDDPRVPIAVEVERGGRIVQRRSGLRGAPLAVGALVVVLIVGALAWRADVLPALGATAIPAGTPAASPSTGGGVERDAVLPGYSLTPSPPIERASVGPAGSLPGVPIAPPANASFGGAAPLSSTTCPADSPVKGNVAASGERIFHVVGQEFYAATRPEACFADASAARAAGFRASLR